MSLKRKDRKAIVLIAAVLAASPAYAQDIGANPAGSGAIVSAARWLEGTLLGTIATVVAVIAVASVGFLMLTGRINWRYGATVIIGCFILFGAPSIAAVFVQTFEGSGTVAMAAATIAPAPTLAPAPLPPPTVYDPYAGASVERR